MTNYRPNLPGYFLRPDPDEQPNLMIRYKIRERTITNPDYLSMHPKKACEELTKNFIIKNSCGNNVSQLSKIFGVPEKTLRLWIHYLFDKKETSNETNRKTSHYAN